MENTLFEINKHKYNILSLSNKLINTFDINQEILINNELKKESEFLLSLLNIKQNEMMNQMAINNNMNFINPMMNQNFINNNNQLQQMIKQQMIQIQAMQNQQQIQQEIIMKQQNEQKLKEKKETIALHFRENSGRIIVVICKMNDKIDDVIKKYRNKSLDRSETIEFIWNSRRLSPNLTVGEEGLTNNSFIFALKKGDVVG